MNEKPIYITEYDLERMTSLVEAALKGNSRGRLHLSELQHELERAIIVTPQQVPCDVVTMNSTVSLMDIHTAEEKTYTLVFPENAHIEEGKISILAPIGTALIGYCVGDVIEWDVPSGRKTLQITKILYQPEAAGRYDL